MSVNLPSLDQILTEATRRFEDLTQSAGFLLTELCAACSEARTQVLTALGQHHGGTNVR